MTTGIAHAGPDGTTEEVAEVVVKTSVITAHTLKAQGETRLVGAPRNVAGISRRY